MKFSYEPNLFDFFGVNSGNNSEEGARLRATASGSGTLIELQPFLPELLCCVYDRGPTALNTRPAACNLHITESTHMVLLTSTRYGR